MTYKRLFFYILLIILAAPAVSLGQQTPSPASDTARIEVREPPADKLSEYRNNGDFTYEATPKEAETFLDKIKYWIREKLGEFLNQPGTQNFLDIIFYVVFAGLILALLNEFMKGNIKSLFSRKNALKPRTFSVKETDGNERDLDRLIREAVDNNQLGLAVRYLYRRSLMQLQKGGFINWKKNKTNREYLYEIQENELRELFQEVSRYYEYAEYGNYAVSDADFNKMRRRFDQMETITKNRS